jgi:hypothetical protein
MRPLKINPGHAITGLALSPDGQKLGVVQSVHGFRLFDAITGTELGRDTARSNVYEASPTGRHSLHAAGEEIRLAEVIAGRPFLRFQTGWTRAGELNRPPAAPETSALPLASMIGAAWAFDRRQTHRYLVSLPFRRAPDWVYLVGGALTADHRFAVGRVADNSSRFVVCDLADETVVASNLDLSASRSGYENVRTAFTPDGTRVLALTPRALFAFDLPPPAPLGSPGDIPSAPVLFPAVTIRVTQPQPDPEVPPFAVLPCGTKVLLRGEKSRVELRDLATGEVLTVWKWGLPKVSTLAVAGDGLTAAAGGTGGRVVIWDLG